MIEQASGLLVTGALLVAALMTLLWALHLALRNASVVDPGWAGGLALLAVFYAASGHGYPARAWLMGTMAGLWGLRLALFLLFTRVIGHPEEGRYVELRRKWRSNLSPIRKHLHFDVDVRYRDRLR